jgi:murein DD-endopeptidase MepM/ murein hydrolase activator NlpD
MVRAILSLGLVLALAACGGRAARPDAAGAGTPAGAAANAVGSHVVQRGETLASIARRYGTDYSTLARLNGLSPPYTIHPGQQLRLPGAAGDAAGAAAPVQAGGWVWPTSGRTVRGFSPALGGNKGLDIAGQLGQPVRATAAGTVVYAGNGLRQYGNLVIVKHSPTYLSAYGYLQRIDVAEGSAVTQGQAIAVMGSPGDGGGLLHFEIRLHGTPVDPAGLLPAPTGG